MIGETLLSWWYGAVILHFLFAIPAQFTLLPRDLATAVAPDGTAFRVELTANDPFMTELCYRRPGGPERREVIDHEALWWLGTRIDLDPAQKRATVRAHHVAPHVFDWGHEYWVVHPWNQGPRRRLGPGF